MNGVLRVWNLPARHAAAVTASRPPFGTELTAAQPTPAPPSSAPDQIQYTNAKVLLVGESGAGKTGLSNYLAHGIRVEDGNPLPSTVGAWA